MNQNQKIVIFIALILFLCCGIFVPYDGTETHIRTTYATMSWGNESPRPAVVTTEKANSFIDYEDEENKLKYHDPLSAFDQPLYGKKKSLNKDTLSGFDSSTADKTLSYTADKTLSGFDSNSGGAGGRRYPAPPRSQISRTESEVVPIGYFPIFNPPSKRDMYKSFYPDYENDLAPNYEVRRESGDLNNEVRRKILGEPALPVFNSKKEYVDNKIDDILKSSSMTYESNINLSRLIIQIFILLIITIGLVLLFADSRHKEKPISKKEV